MPEPPRGRPLGARRACTLAAHLQRRRRSEASHGSQLRTRRRRRDGVHRRLLRAGRQRRQRPGQCGVGVGLAAWRRCQRGAGVRRRRRRRQQVRGDLGAAWRNAALLGSIQRCLDRRRAQRRFRRTWRRGHCRHRRSRGWRRQSCHCLLLCLHIECSAQVGRDGQVHRRGTASGQWGSRSTAGSQLWVEWRVPRGKGGVHRRRQLLGARQAGRRPGGVLLWGHAATHARRRRPRGRRHPVLQSAWRHRLCSL